MLHFKRSEAIIVRFNFPSNYAIVEREMQHSQVSHRKILPLKVASFHFSSLLRLVKYVALSFSTKNSGLKFWTFPVANGTAFSGISEQRTTSELLKTFSL